MKTFNFYLIIFLALFFFQCKEKTNQTSDTELESETQGTITATVYRYNTNIPMKDVVIAIEKDGVDMGRDTTNNQGSSTLTTVDAQTEYIFLKEGYNSQTIQFVNYAEINAINVYLKPSDGLATPTTNVNGVVYNGARQRASNVTVRSNQNTTTSSKFGRYSLDISPQNSTFPLNYLQGSVQGSISMTGENDTVIVDIFIDGFTDNSDSINVVKENK